jgi:hypothetical protein
MHDNRETIMEHHKAIRKSVDGNEDAESPINGPGNPHANKNKETKKNAVEEGEERGGGRTEMKPPNELETTIKVQR